MPITPNKNKTTAAFAGGALATIVTWIVAQIWKVEMPVEVAQAFSTLCAGAAAWLATHVG